MIGGGIFEARTMELGLQNQALVIRRGETLGGAIVRHRRAHGLGRLVLTRDLNARSAGRAASLQAAA